MSARRPPTQLERVLRALRRGPVTQLDFLSPACDRPITRLASRVTDLRARGHVIESALVTIGHARMAEYRLAHDAPTAGAVEPPAAGEQATLDLGGAITRPARSPYDVWSDEA